MVLGREKTEEFYALLSGLANYVNAKLNIEPDIQGADYNWDVNEHKAKNVLKKIWSKPALIDEYLEADGKNLTDQDRGTIALWKNRVEGQFVVERSLRSGGVLIDIENECAYLVQNFRLDWTTLIEMAGLRIPAIVRTCLLPYDGMIVTDGMIEVHPVIIGAGMKRGLKQMYRELKEEGLIYKTL